MRAISQDEHEKINAREYPGTRQLCSKCEDTTGRCEEDYICDENGSTVCEDCYAPDGQVKLMINKFLCLIGIHRYYSYMRLYIGDDEWNNEVFRCKHCGSRKHE